MNKLGLAFCAMTLSLLLFASCDGIGSLGPAPNAPSAPTVAAGGESLTVSWGAVSGATSYAVYYTSDGSTPVDTSSAQQSITATSYAFTGLDAAKAYKFSIQAIAGSKSSALSAASDGVSPLPMLHMTISFNNYANSPAAVGFFTTSSDGTRSSAIAYLAGTTSASGGIAFDVPIDRTNCWGYTVFKDTDSSKTVTTGDIVWGDSPAGYFNYLYYSTAHDQSATFTVDWDTRVSTNHVY